MANCCHEVETGCSSCAAPPRERLNYFTGQFLAERDFSDEQGYLVGKHRQHNRLLHGAGTVCGLRLAEHPNPECQDRYVILEPGLALDCCGREIQVCEETPIDLRPYLSRPAEAGREQGPHLLFSLCYKECPTELVPALYSECACDEDRCEPNRIREDFEVRVERVDRVPERRCTDTDAVRLSWLTTLQVGRALATALDAGAGKLYVLSGADPGQVHVYDSAHHCLVKSIDLGTAGAPARGMDLALSADRDFLYVIRHEAGTPGRYTFRVLRLKDPAHVELPSPQVVKDYPLAPGPPHDPPRLAVAGDGRVFVLDRNANPKAVTVWKTDIHAGASVPGAVFATRNTIGDPYAIAVSPDGTFLFVTDTQGRQVEAVEVATLAGPPSGVFSRTFSTNEKPAVLAVSGDGRRVSVVTAPAPGQARLRAFQVQKNPPFPEIGTVGAALDPGDARAVAASATGRWSFVALTDANGKGSVRVVDVDRLETAPLLAAGAPVDVITEPRTLLLAPDTRAVYVAGEGDPAALCGGVAVLATQEEDCKAILDRGPVACPECGDECVVLAVVENYRPGERLTRERLRNDVRCVVPSAETLRDVLWCFECEPGGGGATGPRGERGEPGEQGKPGNDGRGLNPDLPKILDVGWLHKGSVRFDDFGRSLIYDNDPREAVRRDRLPLLTLYFSHEMNDIDRQVLQVEIEYPQTGVVPGGVDNQAATHALGAAGGVAGTTQTFLGIYNIMNLRIYGHIVPVVPGIGTPLLTPHTNERAAWAVAFIPYRQFFSAATRFWLDQAWLGATRLQLDPPCVRVSLLGEFVWTGNHGDEGGILDADNVGGRVGRGPTRAGVPAWIRGGRNPSGNLAQGGVFRSWFFLTRPEKLPDRGPRDDDARRELGLNLLGGIRARAVNLRTATADELRTLDGVDESAAARIVAHRRRNPLNSVSDLLRVEGLGRGVLERNLGRLTVDEGEER